MAITEITQEKQKIETLQQKVQQAPKIVVKLGKPLSLEEENAWPILDLDYAGGTLVIEKHFTEYSKDLEKTIDVTKKDVSKYFM